MRKLTPAYIVTSVAIALASTAALAQLQIQRVGPAPNTTAAPSSTTASSSAPTAAAGGCVGTGGSTCTANTATTNPASTSGTVGSSAAQSETTASGGVTAPAASPSTVTAASSGATASTPGTPESSGDAGSQNRGTVNPSGGNVGNTALVPGVIVGGTAGVAGVNANGERAGIVVANEATPPTPLFELTARQGAEREARRRARGEEPRVYGIAPRTDRDLTHQMPDDPIIRY